MSPFPRSASRSRQAASDLRWCTVVSGDNRELGRVRHWLRSLLPDCPAREDVMTVAVELCTNALKFSASGQGGWLALEITWHVEAVRVAVADQGRPAGPQLIEDPMGEHGRGLLMVRALATRLGVAGGQRGRLVWADVPWAGTGAVPPSRFSNGYEAMITEGETTLARQYMGIPTWFGRSTLQWWALPAPGSGLITAPSAAELADRLGQILRATPTGNAEELS